jgi:glycosyltransferase involved in cell wall biosynthesis
VTGTTTPAERDTVAFVSIAAGLGGSTKSLVTVLSGLDADVRRVVVTPESGKFPALVRERRLAAEQVVIPKPSGRRARRLSRPLAAIRIARWARRERGRLLAIHANGLQEVSLVVPAALVSGAPLVMWIHDFEVYPWTRRLGPMWRRLLRGRPVRWAAVSETARRMVVESGLAAADEVEIVTNPIDPADVLAPEHVPADRFVIGFVGSAERRKGFHLLPEVDRRLADLGIRWMLFTSRTDNDLDPVWERLRALPADRIDIAGKTSDIRTAYARFDLVFCPSLKESFCRVAAEAMMNGLPVVASDLEPLRALLGGSEPAGLLVAPEDADAAASAIRRVVEDPALRDSLGDQGRERARSFEPAEVVHRLATLYGARDGAGQVAP